MDIALFLYLEHPSDISHNLSIQYSVNFKKTKKQKQKTFVALKQGSLHARF